MKIFIFSLSVALFLVIGTREIYAQHDDEHHHHGLNEIGVNFGSLYAIDDKGWGAGVHMHYFRSLGEHSRWAIGGFVEQTLFMDNHFAMGVGAKFNLLDRLSLTAMPGIVFTKHDHSDHDHDHEDHSHDNSTKTKFSVHTELTYVLFEWGKFHMGPAIDYSWSKDDSHMMLGVHAAFDF